jgi:hypothetical protein
MTDEQYVLQKRPKAIAKWKQSEQPSCFIDDGFGQILGVTPNDFPARTYPEIIRAAWEQARQNLTRSSSGESS